MIVNFVESRNIYGKAMLLAASSSSLFVRWSTTGNADKENDKEVNEGASTGVKRSESFSANIWRRLILSVPHGGHSRSRSRVGEIHEAELPIGTVFIHTLNAEVRLRKWSRRLWWFIARNQLLKILWSCATFLWSLWSFTGSHGRFFKTGLTCTLLC